MSNSVPDRLFRLFGKERDPSLVRNGRRFLRDAMATAREADVTPFLMWGTLLGCVRDSGFIRHDGDIDLGIRSGDYDKRGRWIALMQRRGYRLHFDRNYKFRFSHPWHSLHIDVDVFYPHAGQVVCADRDHEGRFLGEAFAIDAFDRLRETEFLGLRVFVPDPPEAVLEAVYGSWREPRRDYDSRTGPLNRILLEPGAPLPPLEAGLRAGY